jgi:hypothetical protein
MASTNNPYLILGVSSEATDSQIKAAFEFLTRKIVNKGRNRALDEAERLIEILIAYSILINPTKRLIYDGVNYYEFLEVTQDATTEQIRRAFRKQARRHHPDVNPGNRKAETQYKKINEAYEILNDMQKRQIYDHLWVTFREWIEEGNSPLDFEWPTSVQVKTDETITVEYETVELQLHLFAPEDPRSEALVHQYPEHLLLSNQFHLPEQQLLLPTHASPSSEVVEDVYFMVCHPMEVLPEKWYSLLSYAYVDSVLELVRQDAHKFSDEMAHSHRGVRSKNASQILRGTEILLVPEADGIEFKPNSLTLRFDEDFERGNFRFSAKAFLAGQPCFGEMAFFVGPVQIANIRFSVFVSDAVNESTILSKGRIEAKAKMYQKIFVSYSHMDTGIVIACKQAFEAIGNDVLVDFDILRSGEAWDARLFQIIDEADIFQLFWSKHSSN